MLTIGQIYEKLNIIAPFDVTVQPDNVGLLVGRRSANVSRVLVALDATPAVIAEAQSIGAQLIVTHHPIFFRPLDRVNDVTPNGRRVLAAIEAGIAVISMHTNLDVADGGVNDCLAECLGLSDTRILPDGDGVLRYGTVTATDLRSFVEHVRKALTAKGLRCHDAGKAVRVVAVGGGSCAEYADAAVAAGCDTLVVGDSAYHRFQHAAEVGLNLIEAGHFATEDVVCERVAEYLRDSFDGLDVRKSAALVDELLWL